jgi:hypothetical protein
MPQLNFRYGWIIKGGQKYFTPHHEKGARNKNFEAERTEAFEVGHAQHVRKDTTPIEGRSAWFSEDAAREIPPAAFISE